MMQNNRMIVALALVLVGSPMVLQAASVESSRADMVEPLQQQESAEVGNQLEAAGAIGSAESELDDILADDNNSMGASASQLQDQKWTDEGEETGGGKASGNDQDSLDSNIESAKIETGRQDLATAAGYHHHHHHGHHVHGKMSMGAHSGHKGAFGWHAKFPVGGKGRR